MTIYPGIPVDEIRGRLLHEQLLAEARVAVASQDWETETLQPPMFACTDSGTMLPIVIAG